MTKGPIYTATEKERNIFHYLHDHFLGIMEQYNVEFDLNLDTQYPHWMSDGNGKHYFPYVIRRKSVLRRVPVIIISPPFMPYNVDILDARFMELGKRLKEESFKFSQYGKPDQYDGEEIEKTRQQMGFAFAVLMRASEIGNTENPTEEDKLKAFVELESKKIREDYLRAMN